MYRQFQQNQLTFSMMYYYDENFMLPLSHDEVVHGKSPMIYKMPGDEWQKFANLRLLYTYMFMHPGGKLLFMGNEFGQTDEWNYKTSLRWDLLQYDCHTGLKNCVSALAHLVKQESALCFQQFNPSGFEWHELNHREESVVSFFRRGKTPADELLIILNMTPVERTDWKVIMKNKGTWKEIFNSDNQAYWGTDQYKNEESLQSIIDKDKRHHLLVQLPPLAGIVLKKVD